MPKPPVLLSDADIAERLDAATAVTWCAEAIAAAHRGELLAPPRAHADLGDGRFAFTAGRMPGRWYGYRSYDTLATEDSDQVVTVHSEPSGRVAGIAIGSAIGPLRTGAIGGAAARALAAPDATTVGIIGCGTQAWTQLWAINAVRDLSRVTVYARTAATRERFAAEASQRFGLDVCAAACAEDAVAGAQIVILATSSGKPVVDTAAIAETAYVTTLGPKQTGRAEFDGALARRSGLIVTDSLPQLQAYEPPFVLRDTDGIVSLGAVLAGEVEPRPGTLFCSVGLAGTEAYLVARLLGR